MTYLYKCPACFETFEVQHPMAERGKVEPPCPRCSTPGKGIINGFPHVAFSWRAYDAADTGSDRLTLHSAKAGKPSPLSEWSGKRS